MDGDSRATIQQSTLTTDRVMDLINNHARTPLTPDQVYVFDMILSGQALDTYVTRMARSTLKNYKADFAQGRALMNSHRAGRFNGELPVGRTFATEIRGDFLPDDAPFEATGGAALSVSAYIQRGLRVTDVSTDDLIRGIDGGTINDVSVGFTMGPDGLFRCSLCSRDMADWWSDDGCPHIPGVAYEDGRAFAWVENANGVEGSLVYKGANPEAMISKAVRLVETGQLSRRDALMLEDQWGVRFISGLGLGGLVQGKGTAVSTGMATKPERKEERQPSMEWEQFLKDLRAQDAAQADRIAALPEGERLAAITGVLRGQRATIDSLSPRADMGDKWLESLIEDAVSARVRAEGQGDFDATKAERYRVMLRSSANPALIQDEIASWQRKTQAALGDGKRQTAQAGQETAEVRAPSAAYRG